MEWTVHGGDRYSRRCRSPGVAPNHERRLPPGVASNAGQGILPDSVPPAPDVEDGSPVPPKSAIRAFAEAAADLGVEPVPLPRFHDDVA